MRAQMLAAALRGSPSRAVLGITATGTYSDEVTDPDDSQTVLTFKTDGTITVTTNSGGTVSAGVWATGPFNPGAHTLTVTVTAGSFSTGTTGSALALSSERSFSVARTSIGVKGCTADYVLNSLPAVSLTLSASVAS